jgi:heme iron utilization protein
MTTAMDEERSALAAQAKRLLADADKAMLGTLAVREGTLFPFVSLIQPVMGLDGEIILLMSDLSDHARHLAANPAASLLIDGTSGLPQPLAGPRLTIIGEARRSETPAEDRAVYLARHEHAALYADFGDFNFYRLRVREGYFVAGFGRVPRLGPSDLRP